MMDERKDAHGRTDRRTDGWTWATLNALPHSANSGGIKSISGGFIHQAGIFGVKCFSIFCGLILADSKNGEILMPNDLIALGFCSYKFT